MVEIENAVAQIIAEVLEINAGSIEQITREHYAAWDSLNHLQIMMAIEETFKVRFTPGEIADIRNAEEIVALIREKLNG